MRAKNAAKSTLNCGDALHMISSVYYAKASYAADPSKSAKRLCVDWPQTEVYSCRTM